LDERAKARALIDEVVMHELEDPYLMYLAGHVYEQLGERVLAMEWIKNALEKGYLWTEIEQDAGLDQLRNDTRFQRLLKEQRHKSPLDAE
jgi:hypothetical protein